jgi:hypothetical protein
MKKLRKVCCMWLSSFGKHRSVTYSMLDVTSEKRKNAGLCQLFLTVCDTGVHVSLNTY